MSEYQLFTSDFITEDKLDIYFKVKFMREIKFRAWLDRGFCRSNPRMIYEKMAILSKNVYKSLDPRDRFWSYNPLQDIFYVSEEYQYLMQYTEIKDKNGKFIYEGDIINKQYDNGSVIDGIGIVHFGDGTDSDGYQHGAWLGWKAGRSSLLDVHAECEIIGNIYENSELKEQAKKYFFENQ
jgi:uncharacterized phage protein (TIGR01671 family)